MSFKWTFSWNIDSRAIKDTKKKDNQFAQSKPADCAHVFESVCPSVCAVLKDKLGGTMGTHCGQTVSVVDGDVTDSLA